MSRATQWDGYIVQRTPPAECQYKGAASAEVWPLTSLRNTLASELTEQVREQFYGYDAQGRYRLWIVPSIDLVLCYFRACESLKIGVRLLVCAAPGSEVATHNYTSLGWDIVSPSFSSSLIDLELFSDDPGFGAFRKALNKNGLFDSLSDLAAYRSFRQSQIALGEDLENAEGMRDVFLGGMLETAK